MTTPATTPSSTDIAMTLRGPLDSTAVNHLLDHIAQLPDQRQLLIDCTAVSSVDPVGTARLWALARELELAGRMLRVIGMPERFVRRLRLHPILRFLEQEDMVFTDPFMVVASSR
jgi:ABC-type transporter Mla MlaB component